jgi:hypothetical protein
VTADLALLSSRPDRVGRDRLEILTALIGAPSFDPIFRADIVRIPLGHPTYRWWCLVSDCERVRSSSSDMCAVHIRGFREASRRGVGKAAFLASADPLPASEWTQQAACRAAGRTHQVAAVPAAPVAVEAARPLGRDGVRRLGGGAAAVARVRRLSGRGVFVVGRVPAGVVCWPRDALPQGG